MSGRRRGKPNRCGGRFNRPRGGSGGSNGSKKGASGWDDGDDFSLDLGPSHSFKPPPPHRRRGVGTFQGTSRGLSRGKGQGSSLSFPRFSYKGKDGSRQDEEQRDRPRPDKVHLPLQRIHMTSENQLQVKELLRELQSQEYNATYSGSDYEAEEEDEEYDELDHREEGQFWITQDDGIECAEDSVGEEDCKEEMCATPEAVVSLFALGTLCRYGFDRDRSRKALQVGQGRSEEGSGCGEVGATLELLLVQMFAERFGSTALGPQTPEPPSQEECVALRQEEALALTAIYGERFCERINDRVWTVSLDLVWMTEGQNSTSQPATDGQRMRTSSTQLCKFYLKGSGCKFGSRCKFKHESPTESSGHKNLYGPSQPGFRSIEPPVYQLEVRFPQGSCYPFQPPLAAFSTTDDSISGAGRLNVTEYLFSQSLTAAQDGEPVVYTLISCLEEDGPVRELLSASHHKYSAPPPVLAPPAVATTRSRSTKNTTVSNTSSSMATTFQLYNDVENPKIRVRHIEERILTAAENLNTHGAEDEDDEYEEDGEECVPIENESYVNLRKKLEKKSETRAEDVLKENRKLCREFRRKSSSRRYVSMQHQRCKLPVWEERGNILDCLEKNQVIVISGMTGCGKTTQIAQFILDDSLSRKPESVANIICTQPRRISAIAVATRVAHERAEVLGHSTGYQIRLETIRSSSTRLLFCTTGVLLRRLEGDAELKGVTHVIVDEVHERTEESDFLLLVLKDLMVQRTDLKIMLMSATLNADLFSQYFYDCPTIHIPGRTFPVDQFFLEDAITKTRYMLDYGSPYRRSTKQNGPSNQGSRAGRGRTVVADMGDDDSWSFSSFMRKDAVKDSIPDQQLSVQELTVRYPSCSKSVVKTLAGMDLDKINMDLLESLLEWIVDGDHNYPPGAVLVFLPGLAEIKQLYEQLQSNRMFNNRTAKRCVVYPLHSSLSSDEQQAVFTHPPAGVTKIIISTNIAETSVTIDDVVYVIDSGKMKEKRYDASRSMESLEDVWVSHANALQRRGRAGRVASGLCFHLFTSHCFTHQLSTQQLPEIQRVPLEQLCLRIKVLEVFSERSLDSVFSRLIEPPGEGSLEAAKRRLCALGALTEAECLTPLGWHLACLPVDVRIGKLMLLGAIFRCLDPALTIAASLAFKSPFVSPWDKREEANERKLNFSLANSDHLALLQAYKGWCHAAQNGSHAGYQYCRENFLSIRGLQEIACLKRQFAELLSDIGFVRDGLKSRDVERMSSTGTDGVLEATGYEANLNSDNTKLMSAMLCAALYPNVVQVRAPQGKFKQTSKGAVKMQPKAEELRFLTKTDGAVHIHPSSVNFTVRHYDSPYLVYHEKVKTSRVFIRDCSMVCVYPMVLFGGGQISVELQRGEFIISLDDGWIRFAATSHEVAELVKELRWELDQLLEEKIRNPSMNLITCPRGSRIIHTIVSLISTQ
ncbi:putative ATP-dependent RNA helicase DHX57 isoform X1 [Electrophorus electricus]|uniref:Putative ATP-dependent RNA helicase DHX57 n=1 Tax=Electrophorus electricus TaxID=8005 RepID=A0A4W4E6B5_ELEEL|nr:putative ATP-dependent RNA helicase DHX57 isoform X1 [Electrophorus electricus]